MPLIFNLIVVLINSALLCDAVCPQGVLESGVSQNESNFIVNEHNRLRMMLANGQVENQPRAINLKRMYWDDKLAQDAQNVANTCDFKHVIAPDSRWTAGQNLGSQSLTHDKRGANWSNRIMAWWNEHRHYNYPNKTNKVTGHYTQMAYHSTMYIGCGYTHFPKNDGVFKYEKFYVCNYGPGKYRGVFPYKTGNSGCENLC